MGIIWPKTVDTAWNSALTLRKLPSLKVMRPNRVKIQLFKVPNFLWGEGVQVGDGCKILRLWGATYLFCFQQLTFRHDSYYFFNALFSAVTTDFHQLVLVKSWNGFLYRNITYKRNVLLTIAFRWMVNRTHIITLTVQHNTMHHRKVLLNSFPYSDILYSNKNRPSSPLNAASVRKTIIT